MKVRASIRASVSLHPFSSSFRRESRLSTLLASSLFSAVVVSSVVTSLSIEN